MQLVGRLYLLFTPALCRHDPWRTLTAALDAGVDMVQWRSKHDDRDGLHRCREICRRFDVPMLINDDVMLAVRSCAYGAHVGQDDMPADAARKLLGTACLGISTHDPEQIGRAAAAGADYIGFGPCHATATKGYEHGLAPAAIEAAVAEAARRRLPLFAIGGIRPDNLLPLRLLGVDRIAVSSCVLDSDDPAGVVARLRSMV
ncbi:MAG: thiamine phosphate synthase [Planctomycetes bacterium]|nr:thiamine phosphate synthase [Planctomycetota bacterium]MCC7396042.1 thiamine phosphate synthase [Planctomycetota bacterium]